MQRWLFCLALIFFLPGPAPAQNFPFPIPGNGDLRSRDFERQALGTLLGIIIDSQRGRHPGIQFPRGPQRYPQSPPNPPQSSYPQNPGYDDSGRPGGYDTLVVNGLPARLDPRTLPIRVYSNDGRYHTAFTQGITLWNHTGLGTFFTVSPQHEADLIVDWSGQGVSAGARAETRFRTSNQMVVPQSIVVRPGQLGMGDLGQVMTHELGHVLGLDHSSVRSDVMYRSEQRSGRAELTSRDLQMLRWLYSQQRYIPVVGSRNQSVVTASLARGFNACGHQR